MQKEIFGALRRDNYLIGLDQPEFIAKLAEYAGDLNALHPFRDGNGRAIREFLRELGVNAGFSITYNNEDNAQMLEADIAAFHGDTKPLIAFYAKIVEKLE